MQRQIKSIRDILPAYAEYSTPKKVLIWCLVPLCVLGCVILGAFLWKKIFPATADKLKRNSQVKKFNTALDKQDKRAAKLIKQKAEIQKKGEKVINDASKILEHIESSDLSLYDQQQLRKRLAADWSD